MISTVQEIYAAFGLSDLQAILSPLADDVVWETEGPAIISFTGARHGIAETKGFFEAIGKDHLNPVLTMTDYVGSADTVAAIGRYEVTLKATGKRVNSPVAHYWKFRDGKVARYTGFLDTAAVVEGLKP